MDAGKTGFAIQQRERGRNVERLHGSPNVINHRVRATLTSFLHPSLNLFVSLSNLFVTFISFVKQTAFHKRMFFCFFFFDM